MVEVKQNASATMWQMKYKGQVDYLDTEPTEGDKRMFRESVDALERRAQVMASLPPIPADRKTEADYR
jgi:hypothetical protein